MNKALSWKVLLLISLIALIASLILRGVTGDVLVLLTVITGSLGLINLFDSQEKSKEEKGYKALKYWTVRDWGRNAITGLLGGALVNGAGGVLWSTLGGILMWAGVVCGAVWLYKLVWGKSKKQVQL